jgi:F-type H+-transporting ATPase subunit epsilon
MAVEVHLVTPEREVWSGQVDMVVARGVDGEVGILAGHAPLLIRLAVGTLRMMTEGTERLAVVDGGFLHVTTDDGVTRVDVLATSADLASELDGTSAQARLDAARQRAEETDDDAAQAELARASARAAIAGR